jgi:hypothetical protein
MKNNWKKIIFILLASLVMLLLTYWDMVFYMANNKATPFVYSPGPLTILFPASIVLFAFCIIAIVLVTAQPWLQIKKGLVLSPLVLGALGALPGILAMINIAPNSSKFFFSYSMAFMVFSCVYLILGLTFYIRNLQKS